MAAPRYSIITPSRGDRPRALTQAIDSVTVAVQNAQLSLSDIEMLVGFDGVKGEQVRTLPFLRYINFPAENDYGNGIRNGLLKAAKGHKILFLDDDNALTTESFCIYESFYDVEMLIARIDVSRAHSIPWLPVIEKDKETVRQSNIDPLCLCLTRELVTVRCNGWQGNGYQADYINMFHYYRRAKTIEFTERYVGIYDIGRNLDKDGMNFRQRALI